jgi:anti-repressor protein
MEQKTQPVQGTLFPELEPQEAHSAKPSKKTAKQIKEELHEEIRQQQATIEAQKAEIETLKKEKIALQSKAAAFDELVNCRNLFPIGTIAKAFGRTAEWMNKYLADKGIQYKRQGDIWKLYAQYDSCGYTGVGWYPYSKDAKGRDLVRAHTYWTAKGMAFIRELLIADGLWED